MCIPLHDPLSGLSLHVSANAAGELLHTGAREAIHQSAALEEEEGGHGLHLELLGDLTADVYVHLRGQQKRRKRNENNSVRYRTVAILAFKKMTSLYSSDSAIS